MTTPEEQAVIEAALEWYAVSPVGDGDTAGILHEVKLLIASRQPPGPRTDQARPMTWGTVPAGWYVKAPDGQWYRVVLTMAGHPGQQHVTLDIGGADHEWSRKAQIPVTACPGPPNATDAAIEALGFPQILEDGL
jgi:hypothetical protein